MNDAKGSIRRLAAFGLALAGMATGAAHALTLQDLQRQLQAAPVHSVSFHERRESPWLSAPVESRGTLHATAEGLEKRVVTPRQETWRLLPDRMEWLNADGSVRKQLPFGDAPAVSALAHALRRIVAADLAGLEPDFRLQVGGDAGQWTVTLQPRDAEVRRHLDHLELQGTASHLQVIIVVERQGERTITRLHR